MKLAPLELRQPASLRDALGQLAALGTDGQVLAGGQSLLPLLRYRVVNPQVLIDINGISELKGVASSPDGLRIGALVRHAELERPGSDIPPVLGALLAAHAREIAFAPVRRRGTVVGSLVQADPKGDWPLLFCALDARIELASVRTTRAMPVRTFIQGPLETARALDEIAVALTVPHANAAIDAWGRSKLMHRAGEYAMCSALALRRGRQWECWAGAAGDRPEPLPALAEALAKDEDAPPRAYLMARAAEAIRQAFSDLDPVASHRHAVNAVDAVQQALHRVNAYE